ncbi:MAG: zinc-ribbon domain containing protein [Dehalococcoidia bacterium]|nr:zinc-ribbon domain containing protein [Dehalococcoidia bacterium]
MSMSDRKLMCRDCSTEFLFTVGEQEFYRAKGLQNEPQRCPTCRANRRREKLGLPAREMHQVTCAICKGISFVPFIPRLDRPVYCSNCFEKIRTATAKNPEAVSS